MYGLYYLEHSTSTEWHHVLSVETYDEVNEFLGPIREAFGAICSRAIKDCEDKTVEQPEALVGWSRINAARMKKRNQYMKRSKGKNNGR